MSGGTASSVHVRGERTGLVGGSHRGVIERRLRRAGEAYGSVSDACLDMGSGSGRNGFGFSKSFSIFMSRICQGRNVSLLLEILSSWRFVRRQISGGINVSPFFPLFELEGGREAMNGTTYGD